ncbi:6-phosphofructokinase [Anaerocaecibacter muris]|uniref:6-phosphofructokinase n=1 Tax=Anaerocaecibacter muris TaxID=2941513 RepID=UPI00203D851D|nr:6-phosphofructokinase [Anaerocaecibacter muris]
MKKIAVLTSGGDAPGMNAAIRAVVRYGLDMGMEVMGVERGLQGLIDDLFVPMNMRSVSDIIHRGGTILKTARCPEFKTQEGQQKAIENLRARGVEGLIVIGGDGSFMGAKAMTDKGFPSIGIPGTIDNDLAYTDYTLGFDTACNTILDAINKIRDTMSSHERVSIIEVMGRNCGDLALYTGLCGGAEVIIVPEHKLTIDQIVKTLGGGMEHGKTSGIIVLAEGAGHADELKAELSARTEMVVKSTRLGHVQRGGSPSCRDRYLGTCFGVHAVKLLKQGIGNRIVGIKNHKFYDMDIVEGCAMKKHFDNELYETALIVGK